MEPIAIEELKAEKCPRISAEDMIELGEFLGAPLSRSPTKKRANSKPMIIIVDVRSADEYPFWCHSFHSVTVIMTTFVIICTSSHSSLSICMINL